MNVHQSSQNFELIFKNPHLTEEDIELLTSNQQKLSEARPELRELDKEIRNIYVVLRDKGAADKGFEEADVISDNHSASECWGKLIRPFARVKN